MEILLVDDEEIVQRSLSRFLRLYGYEVKCVQGGKEALQYIQERPVGLVLSDIRMPGIDGIELVQAIGLRQPGTPVVLMTGLGDEEVATEAFRSGAFDYIQKPMDLEQLLSLVGRVEEAQALDKGLDGDRNQA